MPSAPFGFDADKSTATPMLKRRVLHITTMTTLSVLLVWLVILATMRHAHQLAAKDSERDGQVLIAVIAEQVAQAISAIDYTVSFVAQEFREPREPDRLKRLVESGGVRMDNLVLLSVVDENGKLLQTNRGPTSAVDLSDREHIRVQLDGTKLGLFIGKPVRGRESGQWSIQITRAILDSAGRPKGVIVGSLDPHYFERFWHAASIPLDMRIELLGADGALRAVNKNVTDALEKQLVRPEAPAVFERLSRESGPLPDIHSNDQSVTYFKRVGNLPLMLRAELEIGNGTAVRKLLGALNFYYLLFAGVVSFAIGLLGYSLRRSTSLLIQKSDEADAARRQLRDAIEAVPEGFVLYDSEDRLAVMNEAYRRIYGGSSPSLKLGSKFEDILREGARCGQYLGVGPQNFEEFVKQRMELHRAPRGPFEHQISDGRWIRIDEKRTIDGGVVGFRSDITELKQREQVLAHQTSLLTATLEYMGEALSVVDEQRNLVTFNSRFASLLSLPDKAEIIGSPLIDLFQIFAQNEHVLPITANGDAGQVYLESLANPGKAVEWTKSDGRIIEMRSSLLPDGGVVTLYNDVTEERNSALRIKVSEAVKSAMFESSLDGVIIADETGVILEFNEAAEKIFGWRSDEAIGRTIETVIIPERLRDHHKAGLARFRNERRSRILGQRMELPAIDREGREFPTEITIAVIDAGGRTRFSAFVRDISARKRAEQETQAAREAAEAASKAKTEFLAMVSHEFRTPMNGIIGLAELLRTTALDSNQTSYLEGIEESSRRLMVLTTDILDFSRIEAGRLQIQPAVFDLRALIEHAERTTSALVVGKPVRVSSEISGTFPRYVVGDPNRLGQVIANLLSNSAKFTERGEIRICARDLDGGAPDMVRLQIEVSDTGSGIPDSLRNRMFRPFEQGNADITRHHGGSGLGLAICKRLLDLMDGRISFVSEENLGTCFSIELCLPIGSGEDLERSGDSLQVITRSESLKVLVAEDTPTSQLEVRAMLEQLGHEVTVAGNGRSAVELVSEQPFDLVLMDIQMPVMDGIEATRILRSLSGPAGRLPIIAMSAQVLPATLERAAEAGMNWHVSKPLTLQSLAAAIARTCRHDMDGQIVARTAGEEAGGSVAAEELGQALDTLRSQIGDLALGSLLQQLMTDCSQILESVGAAIKASDHNHLRQLAHKLNGLYGQFGFEAARELAEKIELSADVSDVLILGADLADASDQILSAVTKTAKALQPRANSAIPATRQSVG